MADTAIQTIEDIEKIQGLDAKALSDMRLVNKLEAFYEEIYEDRDTGWADDMQVVIGKALQNAPGIQAEHPDAFKKLQDLRMRLKLIALDLQPQAEIEAFLREHLLDLVRIDIKAEERYGEQPNLTLKRRLAIQLLQDDFKDDTPRRTALVNALKANGETVGQADIVIKGGSTEPTVGSWLADYEAFYEAGKLRTELERAKYMSSAKNAQTLKQDERDVLRRIMEVYDFLRFYGASSYLRELRELEILEWTTDKDLEEIDAVIAEPKVVGPAVEAREARKGQQKEFVERQNKEDILKAYKGDPKEEDAIRQLMDEVKLKSNSHYRPLGDMVHEIANPKAADPRDRNRLVAVLKVMAEKGLLERMVKDKRLAELYENHLQQQHKDDELSAFRINPGDPKHLPLMIQFLLKAKMGMKNHESARIGLHLANAMKKQGSDKYSDMAFWDMSINEFNWKERL